MFPPPYCERDMCTVVSNPQPPSVQRSNVCFVADMHGNLRIFKHLRPDCKRKVIEGDQCPCSPRLPLTSLHACELAPDTSRAYASPVGSQTASSRCLVSRSSASAAGVTLARVATRKCQRLSQPDDIFKEAVHDSFTGLQVPLRDFMQKRIREPYSKQPGLGMALVKCLQLIV